MVAKLRAAADARRSAEFFIIARTDARAVHGLDDALRRAEMYLKAGADGLFIEAPQSIEELSRIGRAFAGVPQLANMSCGVPAPAVRLSSRKRALVGASLAISLIARLSFKTIAAGVFGGALMAFHEVCQAALAGLMLALAQSAAKQLVSQPNTVSVHNVRRAISRNIFDPTLKETSLDFGTVHAVGLSR